MPTISMPGMALSKSKCPGAKGPRGYSLHRRKGIFYVQLRNPKTGKYGTAKSTRTRIEAEAKKIAAKLAATNSEDPLDLGSITFQEYAKKYVWDMASPYVTLRKMGSPNLIRPTYVNNNLANCKNYLNPRIGKLPIKDIRPQHFPNLYSDLKKKYPGLANSTLANIMNTFKVTMHQAFTFGHIKSDPVPPGLRLTREGKERDKFFDEEIEAILNANWKNPLARLFTELAVFTGMRFGELLAVKSTDLKGNTLSVNESFSKSEGLKCTKSRKTRQVALPTGLADSLVARIKALPPNELLIFSDGKLGKPISEKILRSALKDAFLQAGISQEIQDHRKLGFHSFRHWFVSSLRSNIPESLIGKVVGHTDSKTTDRYHHINDAQLGLVQKTVEPLWNLFHKVSA